MFILVPLDGILDGFSKFRLFIVGNDFIACWAYGNDFIACWAYEATISSLAEHTRKCLKVEYLSQIEYDFQKNLLLQVLETMRIRFLQKKVFKKCHACIPTVYLHNVCCLLNLLRKVVSAKQVISSTGTVIDGTV